MLISKTLQMDVDENTRFMETTDIQDTSAITSGAGGKQLRSNGAHGRVSRAWLALFFLVAGVMHFIFPQAYINVMPPWLGWHAQLVLVSGIAECVGGIGILLSPVRRYAGWGLLALCVAVLPANVQMLLDAIAQDRAWWIIVLLTLRLPLQGLLMRWIWLAAQLSAKPMPRVLG